MTHDTDAGKIFGLIEEKRILDMELDAVSTPSHTFEEHDLADYFANVMSDIGLHVEMMDVTHPTDPSKTSRQPIGRLVGTGGGPSLMFNGHLDTIGIMSGWTVDPYGRTFKAKTSVHC